MLPFTFLGILLLALLTVQTVSNEISPDENCCFKDTCSKKRLCGARNETVTDDCGNTYRVTEECGLSRICCFKDSCSGENICAETNQKLIDSCGEKFLFKDRCIRSELCCYVDSCSGESMCAEMNQKLIDSCGEQFFFKDRCVRSELCCYIDACSRKQFCGARNETFTNDCDIAYRITEECGLSRRCCFKDICSGKNICAEENQKLVDSCSAEVFVKDRCIRSSRRCCYKDRCSQESICAEDGVLRDSCGEAFDVALNCTLSKRKTQPSPTSIPSITESTNEDDTVMSMLSKAACIHSQHLSHLPSSALLFPRHVLANVLCDSFTSCATPGHMVVYKGESMRMSGYCEIVGCQREIGVVNSPRYSRGERVESSTKDLVFTMLAARFGTRFEEIVLAGLVRVGL